MSKAQPNTADTQIHNGFNSLPVEIIKEIFCDVGCPDLFDMKLVCSIWRTIIQDILNIQEIQVSAERYSNAVNVIRIVNKDMRAFQIFQAPCTIRNLISTKIIEDQIGREVPDLYDTRFSSVFKVLEGAIRGDLIHKPTGITSKDATGSTWATIIAMTGVEYSVECLKNESFKNKEEVMAKYRWYGFSAELDDDWDEGIIALYPDSRTFAIFYGFHSYDSDNYDNDNDYFYYDEPDWDA